MEGATDDGSRKQKIGLTSVNLLNQNIGVIEQIMERSEELSMSRESKEEQEIKDEKNEKQPDQNLLATQHFRASEVKDN